jgi:hypothetical protein
MSPDEWLKKLESEDKDDGDVTSPVSNGQQQQQSSSSGRIGGKSRNVHGVSSKSGGAATTSGSSINANGDVLLSASDEQMKQFRNPKGELIGGEQHRHRSNKDGCCCVIS